MFVNSKGDIGQARKQAKANANSSGEPWVIFTDTSSNVRIERQRTGPKEVIEVVDPDPANPQKLWTHIDSLDAVKQGWDMFETLFPECKVPVLVIQRDDEANVFADDVEAFQFVVKQAASGNYLALKALNLNHAPVTLEVALIPRPVRKD